MLRPILFFLFILLLLPHYAVSAVPNSILTQRKSIVTILAYDNYEKVGSATGFVVDNTGIIATNNHVIESANPNVRFMVRFLDNKLVPVERVIVKDEENDLALLRIKKAGLSSVKLPQNRLASQGEDIYVIGSPFGLDLTISTGIVSGVRENGSLIQITAPISPGSSGSPVFNSVGEVIGVAVMLISGGQNLNFAIPSKYLHDLLQKANADYSELKDSISKGTSAKLSHSDSADLARIRDLLSQANGSPGNSSLWCDLGDLYLKNGQYSNAAKAYAIALKFDGNNADILAKKGLAHYELKQMTSARKSLEKALEMDDNNLQGLYYLGLIYYRQKETREPAIVVWRKYLTMDDTSLIADDIKSRLGGE